MKNLVKLLSVYFLLFVLPCFAQQDSMYFSPKYLPDRTYIKNTTSFYVIEFGIQGNREMLEELKKSGIENPSVQTEKEKEKLIITTGKLTNANTFPISVRIEDPENSKLNGITFKGFCKLGEQPIINSIDSSQLEKEQEKNILSVIQTSLQQIKFPDKKMKIGDSFSVKTPVNYSMENMTLDMKQVATYFLQEIKGNKAYFNFTQNYTAKMTYDKSEFSGKGRGKGKLIYDIENQQNIYEKGSGEIKIESEEIYPGMKLHLKMKINTEEKNKIQ